MSSYDARLIVRHSDKCNIFRSFVGRLGEQKRHNSAASELLGNHHRQSLKAGWSWGCFSAIDSNGQTIWIADAHRGDGKRFIVHTDEKLRAFVELESLIHESLHSSNLRLPG